MYIRCINHQNMFFENFHPSFLLLKIWGILAWFDDIWDGVLQGKCHLRCHQIMPRLPIFSITGNRGEHVQNTCSDGIYILYTCILGYIHTFILWFLRIWTGIWFLQGSWEKLQSSSWDFPKSWELCTGWRFDNIVIKHPPKWCIMAQGGIVDHMGHMGT